MRKSYLFFAKLLACLLSVAMILPCFSASSFAVTAQELDDLASSCHNYRKDCWTQSTWSDLMAAVNSAKSLLSGSQADANSLTESYNALLSARDSLEHNGSITECPYCLGVSKSIDDSSVITLTNVSYSSISTRNTIDLNIPSNVTGECGFILYIHGGGWTTGSKAKCTANALQSCKNYGVVTGAMNYRYASDKVDAFDIVDDVQAAVAQAKQTASEYGIDLTKMIVCGQSAGGHIAMLYAYSRADASAIEPVCVFNESGPTDLTNPVWWDSYLGAETVSEVLSYLSGKQIVDAESQLAESEALLAVSPVSYVNKNSVPTIICHGTRDIVVDYSEAQRLAAAFESNGAQYELITFNANHSINKDEKQTAYAKERLERYIDAYLYGNCSDEDHSYTVKNTPKTCASDGYNTYACSVCGKYYVSDVVQAGHTIVTETSVPATYTAAGTQVTKCSDCGKIFETAEIPKLVPEYSVKDGSSLLIDVESKLISNVPQGTDDLSECLVLKGCEVISSDYVVATGSNVEIKSVSGETIASFTAVVSGDLTGDGYVDAFDVATVSSAANFEIDIDGDPVLLCAADLATDGFVDAFDCSILTAIANFEL